MTTADGSIPACAGEPIKQATNRGTQTVYPRVCGGTFDWFIPIDGDGGSIPACAGEPVSNGQDPQTHTVYPRVCGGTEILDVGDAIDKGLSPRVRGNPDLLCPGTRPDGSIPACAGEPSPRRSRISSGKVYPRVCGGTRPQESTTKLSGGLSPRVRGNHRPGHNRRGQDRSIPACAGEPLGIPGVSPFDPVYPRVCGGTWFIPNTGLKQRGLSPRVRGNLLAGDCHGSRTRSIPACAGEPRLRPPKNRLKVVYPRVCGGTPGTRAMCFGVPGLSPRVRGNPLAN